MERSEHISLPSLFPHFLSPLHFCCHNPAAPLRQVFKVYVMLEGSRPLGKWGRGFTPFSSVQNPQLEAYSESSVRLSLRVSAMFFFNQDTEPVRSAFLESWLSGRTLPGASGGNSQDRESPVRTPGSVPVCVCAHVCVEEVVLFLYPRICFLIKKWQRV